MVIHRPAMLQHIRPDGAGQTVGVEQKLGQGAAVQGRVGLQSVVELFYMTGEDLIVVGHDGGPVQIRL